MVCVHSSSWWQLSWIPAASKINRHKEKKQQNNNKPPQKKHFVTSIYRLLKGCFLHAGLWETAVSTVWGAAACRCVDVEVGTSSTLYWGTFVTDVVCWRLVRWASQIWSAVVARSFISVGLWLSRIVRISDGKFARKSALLSVLGSSFSASIFLMRVEGRLSPRPSRLRSSKSFWSWDLP